MFYQPHKIVRVSEGMVKGVQRFGEFSHINILISERWLNYNSGTFNKSLSKRQLKNNTSTIGTSQTYFSLK